MGISETGIWDGDVLNTHQHSPNIADFIINYLPKNELVIDFGAGLGYYKRIEKENPCL